MRFSDRTLLENYLAITKDILVPALKSQFNQNFTWACLARKEDISYIHDFLEMDFIPFSDVNEFILYVKTNNFNIQTRHDMDDFMSKDYVQKIQDVYNENIKTYDSFLIQSQPIRVDYKTKQEYKMGLYTDKRNSMFLSICQKDVKHHILERKHGQMWEVANKVISLPEGYTKWIIHGNNKSTPKSIKLS